MTFADIGRRTGPRDIGYTSTETGFNADTAAVVTAIDRQSPDISQGVTEGEGLHKEQGAGDQGLMFGYACDETDEHTPFPIYIAHSRQRLAEAAVGRAPFLRPDAKSQVTVEHRDGNLDRANSIVVSSQHSPDVATRRSAEAIRRRRDEAGHSLRISRRQDAVTT